MGALNSTSHVSEGHSNYEQRAELTFVDSVLSLFRKGDDEDSAEPDSEVVREGNGEHKHSCASLCIIS